MRYVFASLLFAGLSHGASAEDTLLGDVNAPRFTVIAASNAGLERPTGLAFNPDAPTQLWTVNQAFNGTVMFENPGTDAQVADKRIDSHAGHFMSKVAAITFGAKTFKGTQTFATCQESRNHGNDFMGPTLWPADLDVYARVNQDGPLLGSHIDMLHQSPLCMGITHDQDNVFWVTDGLNGHVVRYDFNVDHGPGHDDHADGIVRRYTEAKFKRVEGIPGHVFLDKESGWLYVADTGNGRVYRMDTKTGFRAKTLRPRNEPLKEFSEWHGATMEVLMKGLDRPSAVTVAHNVLYVTLFGTNEIVAYDLALQAESARIKTTAKGLSDITLGPDNKLWFADAVGNQVVRIEP